MSTKRPNGKTSPLPRGVARPLPRHRGELLSVLPSCRRVVVSACATLFCAFAAFAQNDLLFDAIRANDMAAVETLIGNGADVNARDDNNATPLIIAASIPQAAIVQVLLAAGAKVDASDNDGNTALMKACGTERGFATVELLVNAGADIYAANNDDKLAYDIASEAKAPVNTVMLVSPDEPTPTERKRDLLPGFIEAVLEGDLGAVREALANGLDPNATTPEGHPLLAIAVVRKHAGVAAELVAAGADVNAGASEFNYTPLHSAVYNGDVECAQMLVKAGADLNAIETMEGETPLGKSIVRRHHDIAKLLIAAGANPSITRRKDAIAPLMAAVILDNAELARLLLDAGADTQAVDALNFTALNIAQYHKNAAIIKLLEEAGATPPPIAPPPGYDKSHGAQMELIHNVMKRVSFWREEAVLRVYADNGVDLGFQADGQWHLSKAMKNPNPLAEITFLLASGVDPNARIEERIEDGSDIGYHIARDKTILHVFASLNDSYFIRGMPRVAVIEFLLEHGADPNIKNKSGDTPFYRLFDLFGPLHTWDEGAWKEVYMHNPSITTSFETWKEDSQKLLLQWQTRLAKAFLAAGADVHARNNEGSTPLHLAIQWQDAEILKLLLDAGADPLVKNNDGKTPYDMLKPDDFPGFDPEFTQLLETRFKPQP